MLPALGAGADFSMEELHSLLWLDQMIKDRNVKVKKGRR
jgi:hypothetical protein